MCLSVDFFLFGIHRFILININGNNSQKSWKPNTRTFILLRLSALAVDLISNISQTTARNCVECVAAQRVAELTGAGANQMNSNARLGLPKKAKHLAGDPKHIQEDACPGSLNVMDISTALTRVTRLPVKSQLDTRLAN